MGSPNTNNAPKHGRSMPRDHNCKECGRRYAMKWAKDNHEKLCREGASH